MNSDFLIFRNYHDLVLLIARIITGGIWAYYGFLKISDPTAMKKEFKNFGLEPHLFWGWLITLLELFGGIAMIFGFYLWLVAALFAIECILGIFWHRVVAKKDLPGYSFDLIMLTISLLFMATGAGKYTIINFFF